MEGFIEETRRIIGKMNGSETIIGSLVNKVSANFVFVKVLELGVLLMANIVFILFSAVEKK